MNAVLLDQFYRLCDAPDAIARLRRFILDLAVRGKLVPQDPSEEPANVLLARVAVEKLNRGRVERTSKRISVTKGIQDYSIPSGWKWSALSDIVAVLNGRAYSQHELLSSGTPVLRVGNLFTSKSWYYSNLQLEDDKYCSEGDLIFSWSASFGPFIWHGPKVIYHYHIWKLEFHSNSNFEKKFLYRFLSHKTQEIKDAGHGVSMIHMTKEKMEKLQVPVPPLAEQRRIVAKVDELMALCDRLDAAQQGRDECRAKLTAASLARLNDPADEPAFRDGVKFHLRHFTQFTTRPEQIPQLRQTILNLAVRGKLVPQDAQDEPAAKLLDRIWPIDRSRTKATKAFSDSAEAITSGDAVPFSVPNGWTWVRLQRLLEANREISYGVIKLGDEPKSGGVPTLRCSDVKSRCINLANVRKVAEDIERDYTRTRLFGGEILLNIRGTLGGVALVPTELRGHNVAREVAVIPVSKELSGSYLVNVMASPYFWNSILEGLRGIAYKGLNLNSLRLFCIPLPPIDEQLRIVAKVEELMAVCDQLEAHLTSTQAESRRLLEAVLRDALAPAA